MKKIIGAILALSIAGAIGMTSVAGAAGIGSLDQRLSNLQQKEQRIEQTLTKNKANQAKLSKKEQFAALKQSMTQDKQAVLKNRGDNLDLRKQTNELRQTIAGDLKAIEQSGRTLPDDVQSQIKEDTAQIKDITASLKSTKGQIKDIMDELKGYKENKDYASIDAAFQKIAAIQETRRDQLTQINGLLQKMSDLLSGYVPSTTNS